MLRQNQTLKHLDLSCNSLEEGGARILYNDGIKHNSKVKKVTIITSFGLTVQLMFCMNQQFTKIMEAT